MDGCIFFQMMKVKTHAFRQAHENIDNTLKAAEVVLTQFDVPRQVLIISQTLVVVVIAVVSGPM
jgi:hypothetical protein